MEESMNPKPSLSLRLIIPSAAFIVGSACLLEMAAPGAQATSDPGTGNPDGETMRVSSPSLDSILTLTPTWTLPLAPTNTATTAPVTLTAGQDLSCVKGPHWILYEWVARVNEGETVPLLAKSGPDWPDYYFARKSSGEECWLFGNSSTINGDASSLPVREAPSLPTISYAIENRTGLNVVSVYIRGKDETAWGANRIGTDLLPNASFNLSLTAGFYDVQIVDYRGGILYEKHDTAIGSEQSSRNTLLNNMIRFYFRNIYPEAICRMTVSPIGGTYSDYTIPDDGSITPDETIWMTLLAGKYDITMYGCGGSGFFAGIGNVYIGPAMEGFPAP
jgi:hypothetical protein